MSTAQFTCPAHIKWVTDADQVLIVDEVRNQSHILEGEEATIWNWLALGYSHQRVIPMIAALWSVEAQTAEEELIRKLKGWNENGLLELSA